MTADQISERERAVRETQIEALALGIPPQVASHTLWMFKAVGEQPDDWTLDWMWLIRRADESQRRAIAAASKPWGSYVPAIDFANAGDWETLEALAGWKGRRQ